MLHTSTTQHIQRVSDRTILTVDESITRSGCDAMRCAMLCTCHMCASCRFIVSTNNTMKYNNRIGQNTGTLNTEKNVKNKLSKTAFAHEYLTHTSQHNTTQHHISQSTHPFARCRLAVDCVGVARRR